MTEIEYPIDISILQNEPCLDCNVILEIQPLAPLSMVSELPGSYYKSLKIPNKKILCGLLENALGWHIDLADRKTIQGEIKHLRKKQAKKGSNVVFVDYTKGSTYIPLLMEYFDVLDIQPSFEKVLFYDDLWSKAYRRADAVVHPKGTFNIDYTLIPIKRGLKRDEKKPSQVDNQALEELFKQNLGQFPLYYSTPTIREHVSIEGRYIVKINLDSRLYQSLKISIASNNISYLGNSEGWVDIKIKEQ